MDGIDDAVLTVQEVSAYLKIARSTVYKLAQAGELPGRKVGGTWRFSRKGIEAWLVRPAEQQTTPFPSDQEMATLSQAQR